MKPLQMTNEANAAARLDAKRQAKRDRQAQRAPQDPTRPAVRFETTAIERARSLIQRLRATQ